MIIVAGIVVWAGVSTAIELRREASPQSTMRAQTGDAAMARSAKLVLGAALASVAGLIALSVTDSRVIGVFVLVILAVLGGGLVVMLARSLRD